MNSTVVRINPSPCLRIAKSIVAAKIQNSPSICCVADRESDVPEDVEALKGRRTTWPIRSTLCLARRDARFGAGVKETPPAAYFEAFHGLIRQQRETFQMTGRSQRPPLDPLNALLSFVYAILTHDLAGRWNLSASIRPWGFVDRRSRCRWPWICWKSFGRCWRIAWCCR